MQRYPEIKRFVQETLGCSCPEEVFEKIEYAENSNAPWERRIEVGNRLLIYIVDADAVGDTACRIDAVLQIGVAERNSKGLNRFRLVLVSSSRDADSRTTSEAVFHRSPHYDDRTHLHIVEQGDISSFSKT